MYLIALSSAAKRMQKVLSCSHLYDTLSWEANRRLYRNS